MNKPLVTEKLYDADAYCRAFTATVISCEEAEDREGLYAVVLNRSAFFPEGGGQYADTGTLQEFKKDCETPLSGAVKVVDVQVSDDGIITHYCDGAVTPWAQVTGVLDWEQRFERMQNHTGEHLVSGTVHRLYGLDNIGFHLGDRDVTCDFNGELSDEQLREVERVVNRAVWENVEVYAEYPDPATLPDLDYRSKLELTEDVRLVTIPGYDVCACCAPHVARTGEIGLIKIVNSEKAHGGTRVHMICGPWALSDYDIKQTNIMRIVDLTSTPQEETADAVEALQAQNGHLTHELSVAQVQQADPGARERRPGPLRRRLCGADGGGEGPGSGRAAAELPVHRHLEEPAAQPAREGVQREPERPRRRTGRDGPGKLRRAARRHRRVLPRPPLEGGGVNRPNEHKKQE